MRVAVFQENDRIVVGCLDLDYVTQTYKLIGIGQLDKHSIFLIQRNHGSGKVRYLVRDPSKGYGQSFPADRFEKVIHCIHLESPDGIFIKSGNENHTGIEAGDPQKVKP